MANGVLLTDTCECGHDEGCHVLIDSPVGAMPPGTYCLALPGMACDCYSDEPQTEGR